MDPLEPVQQYVNQRLRSSPLLGLHSDSTLVCRVLLIYAKCANTVFEQLESKVGIWVVTTPLLLSLSLSNQ